jgi:hypothetical protein
MKLTFAGTWCTAALKTPRWSGFFIIEMSTHTAIATTALGVVSAIEVETPTPGLMDLLVKIDYAPIIALDVYTNDVGFFVESYPIVFGYSAAGTVVKTGSGVNNFAVGDRVRKFNPVSMAFADSEEFLDCGFKFCPRPKQRNPTIRNVSCQSLLQGLLSAANL